MELCFRLFPDGGDAPPHALSESSRFLSPPGAISYIAAHTVPEGADSALNALPRLDPEGFDLWHMQLPPLPTLIGT